MPRSVIAGPLSIAGTPPRIGELDSPDKILALIPFTAQFNVTGQPAVSLPLAWSSAGLPIGVQLVAAYAGEDLLIRLASQLERAQPWLGRRPRVHA